VFGYISLAAHLATGGGIDHEQLAATTRRLTRVLDDLVEETSANLPSAAGALARHKRRIGVSVCGYADLLVLMGIPYGTRPALDTLVGCLNTVRFAAIAESVRLARQRGPFEWFTASSWARRTRQPPLRPEPFSSSDWDDLFDRANRYGIRNSSLTALPPSGRSSLLLAVNPSIEPFLDAPSTSALTPEVRAAALDGGPLVDSTARTLHWRRHLTVVETATGLVDEAVSKTINLPSTATVEDVWNIFAGTMATSICAMSVYRDHSRQPEPDRATSPGSDRSQPKPPEHPSWNA
jgi:ribonucleoside-diphosphate reductase alpha chain